MEYKFASDYAREVSEKIQGDIDRILAQRREASNAAKEEARYQEQREKMDDQLYGYTKTSMEVAPSGLEGHYVDGVQYALDEVQKASTQHKLNPTEANRLKMNQARQQYENIKNVATAKGAQNYQTMVSIRNGSIKNLASRDGMSGKDYAEKQYSEYTQAPSWQLSEDGKLMIMQEDGGLVDWNTTRYADLNDVFVPQIKAEESEFMSDKMAEALFKNRYQPKESDYTLKDSATQLPIGILDKDKLYADLTVAIKREGISNPQMWTAASLEQSKRENPGRGDMTPKDQTDALVAFNTDFQQDYFRLEDDSFVGITEGAFNSEGEWVFEVNDDFVKQSNKPEKEGIMAWRTAYKNYVEDIAQGVEDRITPTNQLSTIMQIQEREERNATAAAIKNQQAQLKAQEDTQALLDETYGVRKFDDNGTDMYSVDMPVGALSITVPQTDADDNAYSYRDTNIVSDNIAGLSNVAVQNIIYGDYNGMPYPLAIVLNSQKGVSGSKYNQTKSSTKEYTIESTDDAFAGIWQSIKNKQNVYKHLDAVPVKIYALEKGIIDENEFGSGGFDYDKAVEASRQMNAYGALPPYLRQ
jgi:hypothetical protein